MAEITVTKLDAERFRVKVAEGGGSTSHEVTAKAADVRRYAGDADPAALLDASFRFLLEREPKEAILSRFDLTVIERYFGDYSRVIATYL